MCRTYRPKKRPTYTRLCYRYGDQLGKRVPGEWECGEYPRPGRRRQSGEGRPNTRRCACGAAAVGRSNLCKRCYVQEQVDRLPEEAREFLKP